MLQNIIYKNQTMDLQFRLQQKQGQNRNTIGERTTPGMSDNTKKSENDSLQKYARKTVPINSSNQPERVSVPVPHQPQAKIPSTQAFKSGQYTKNPMNRYYRSDAAPKTQFKHYLSDISNVFYNQRQSLRLLHLYDNIRVVSGILFAVLMVIFISLYFIHPYKGKCPSNATCGVFVHCYKGFKYDKQTNQCILSQQLYGQIQTVCTQRILKAREEWANQECNGQQESIPRIGLNELVEGVQNIQLKRQLTNKLQNFLENEDNQRNLHFQYTADTIMPTTRKYSLYCRFKMFSKTSNFKLGLPIFLLILILVILAIVNIRKKVIAKQIYQELRRKTFAQKLLNISYAKVDVQKEYGTIDQKLWEAIDQLRSKDKDIGFLQDDFLYWKLL